MASLSSLCTIPTGARHIFVVIRYSVLSQSKSWVMSRDNDFEQYKQNLFAEARLNSKFNFFSKLVLPALDKQKNFDLDSNLTVLVLISEQLPPAEQKRLASLKNNRPWLQFVPVAVDQSIPAMTSLQIKKICANAKQSLAYASVRLDDDDVLSDNYCQLLLKYISPDFTNHIITFPKGFECLHDDAANGVTESIQIDYPKVAVGLAHINVFDLASKSFSARCENIFQAGDHTKVDQSFPMIEERSYFAYVKMAHFAQDTAEKAYLYRKTKTKAKPADENIIRQHFNLPADFFAAAAL